MKSDIADRIAVHLDVDREVIAAERIEAFGGAIRGRQLAIIARRLAVLEDHFLIEIAEFGHQANTSCTLRMPRARASASARVLYSAKEARAVAGMPKRCITGCAQ